MERELFVILAVIIFVVLVYGIFSSIFTESRVLPITFISTSKEILILNITKQTAEIKIPAVDNEGNGVVTLLKVDSIPGEGRVLVNINQLFFWVDTQYSIRVARKVAGDFTRMDLSDIDLIYTIETNASLIEGPSAGAAITIATVAVLENKTINPNTMITGTINSDSSVGQVGAIVTKAKAAKDINASLFLVPHGQSVQVSYNPVKKCEKIGPITYCSVEYEQETINVSETAGIVVKEVSNLEEALKYFLT